MFATGAAGAAAAAAAAQPPPHAAPNADAAKHDTSVTIRTQVRGTIPRAKLIPFIYLIKSLCPEIGYLAEFREWDRVYSLPRELKNPRCNVRLRQHQVLYGMPHASSSPSHGPDPTSSSSAAAAAASKDVWPAWSLIYSGLPDRRVPEPCERRPVTTAAVGREAEQLLQLFGCSFSHEYMRKGMRHRTRDGIVVDVYFVERFARPGDPASCKPLVDADKDQCCVVELSADGAAVTPEHLLAFMQYLSPYATLETPRSARRR